MPTIKPTITDKSADSRHRIKAKAAALKRSKAPKATKSIRLPGKLPVLVEITIRTEESDYEVVRKTHRGYVAEEPILFDDGVVLSKEIDGFPFIELSTRDIESITFIDPSEPAKVLGIIKPESKDD